MKLSEIRLYDLKIIKNDEIIYEGKAEDLPEELKMVDSESIQLKEGKAIIIIWCWHKYFTML